MSKVILIEAHFLPAIEYFSCIAANDKVAIEGCEHYQKQTYRNRCYILGANKIQQLTVPVIKGNSKTPIQALKIDYSQSWHKEHWRTIKSAYGKAPFFEFFADYFHPLFENPGAYLFELNLSLLQLCLQLLQMNKELSITDSYKYQHDENIFDARGLISPKKSEKNCTFYQPFQYLQVFGSEFVQNLSIIDLLMNEGPNATTVVTKSMIAE